MSEIKNNIDGTYRSPHCTSSRYGLQKKRRVFFKMGSIIFSLLLQVAGQWILISAKLQLLPVVMGRKHPSLKIAKVAGHTGHTSLTVRDAPGDKICQQRLYSSYLLATTSCSSIESDLKRGTKLLS